MAILRKASSLFRDGQRSVFIKLKQRADYDADSLGCKAIFNSYNTWSLPNRVVLWACLNEGAMVFNINMDTKQCVCKIL